MKTTTQRTLKYLREQGFLCAIVEKWNPYAHVRQDLFGFADILAMKPEVGIVAVQTTSRAHRKDHYDKIVACATVPLWLDCGGKIWLITWAKTGDRGCRKLWTAFNEPVTRDVLPVQQEGTPVL